jgi:uncharacterized protein YacL
MSNAIIEELAVDRKKGYVPGLKIVAWINVTISGLYFIVSCLILSANHDAQVSILAPFIAVAQSIIVAVFFYAIADGVDHLRVIRFYLKAALQEEAKKP